jgi:beta-glucanase (GH16 family)
VSLLGVSVVLATEAEKAADVKPAVAPEAAKTEAPAVAPAPDAPKTTPAPAEEKKPDAEVKKADETKKPDEAKKSDEAKKPADTKKPGAKDPKSYGGGKFAKEPTFEDDFLPGWEKNQKAWSVATWMQNKTQMAPERCATDGQGLLVQTVKAGDPALGGSLESKGEWRYGRWVGRIKPAAVGGALNSFFTIDWDDHTTEAKNDGTKLEIDIEFVTANFGPGKGQVEFAVHHLGDKKSFGKVVDLDFNPSDDFHVWGFDILPDGITWHVDGKVLHEYKCPAGETIPDIRHELFMNSWTAQKWVKGPPKADAKYYIDWVKFYPMVEKK